MVKITTWQADDTCHVALNPSQVHEKKFPNKHRIVISICQLQDQQVPRISTLTFSDVLKVSRLPRKVQRRQFDLKASRLPRKVQRRQFDPVRRQASADIYGGAESTTPATQIEPDVLKVSRLPRKVQRRQFDPVRRQASADIYGGAESTMPATQIEPDVLKASRLPRKMQRRQFDPVRRQASADTSMVVQKVTRLPRNSSLMC